MGEVSEVEQTRPNLAKPRGRPKGSPKTGGRVAGTPNKLTKTIRESIEIAFHEVGGPEYLVKMAIEQPVAFMALLAKVMPTQVEAKIDMQPGYIFRIETVIADGERNQLEAD